VFDVPIADTTLKKKISSDIGKAPATPGDAGPQSPVAMELPSKGAPTDRGDRAAVTLDYNPQRRRLPTELGNYQLLHPIGRGGMGVVYKAYHPRLQRHYAIKLLPGLHLGDDTAIVRLQREMAAAGRVEHEHIVYSSDAGTQDGIDYLVMEYVEGVDLARLVAACDPLPIADVCEIIRGGAGLAHESCGWCIATSSPPT
jgi:hypothetical protein